MGKIKVTLVKSLSGRHDKHIKTAHSLGLRRINSSAEQPDNEMTRGKLAQIAYLVKTEQV